MGRGCTLLLDKREREGRGRGGGVGPTPQLLCTFIVILVLVRFIVRQYIAIHMKLYFVEFSFVSTFVFICTFV